MTSVCLAYLLPPAGGVPQIVFIEQAFTWLPILISFAQFLLLAGLTFYIFRKNAAQKITERHAAWFHKLIVEGALPKVIEFSDVSCDELRVSARKVQ